MAQIGDDKSTERNDPYSFRFDDIAGADEGSNVAVGGTVVEDDAVEPAEAFSDGTISNRGSTGNSDAGSGGGNAASGTAARRGRPRGSRNAKTKEAFSLASGGFEDLIFAVHLLLGLAAEELELDRDEAKKLADASKRLMSHYNVQPSPTAEAWMSFVGAAGTIYGPRALTIWNRTKVAQAKPNAPIVASQGSGLRAVE